GVRAARGVVIGEAVDMVALLAEGGGRGGPGEARADDQDGVLPPVGGVHQLRVEAAAVPLLLDRPRRDSAVEYPLLLERTVLTVYLDGACFDVCSRHGILL